MSNLMAHLPSFLKPSSYEKSRGKTQAYHNIATPDGEDVRFLPGEREKMASEIMVLNKGRSRLAPALLWAAGCIFLMTAMIVYSQIRTCPPDPQLVYCEPHFQLPSFIYGCLPNHPLSYPTDSTIQRQQAKS
jgi:hypothetical protein